jgi:L-ribulose-5-phosphate 3-epimerase
MSTIDRRTFLKTTGATLAASALTSDAAQSSMPWKKAFMLGGISKGPVLDVFERLKEAGFEGVELLSSNNFDRDEVLRVRDKTGLIIHGVSGTRHWSDTLSDRVRSRQCQGFRWKLSVPVLERALSSSAEGWEL